MILKRRRKEWGGLFLAINTPYRAGDWVIATDGRALLGVKASWKVREGDAPRTAAISWLEKPVGKKKLSLPKLRDFASKHQDASILGYEYDLSILADFLLPLEDEFCGVKYDSDLNALHLSGNGWGIIFMRRRLKPGKDVPVFRLEA